MLKAEIRLKDDGQRVAGWAEWSEGDHQRRPQHHYWQLLLDIIMYRTVHCPEDCYAVIYEDGLVVDKWIF